MVGHIHSLSDEQIEQIKNNDSTLTDLSINFYENGLEHASINWNEMGKFYMYVVWLVWKFIVCIRCVLNFVYVYWPFYILHINVPYTSLYHHHKY